MDAHDHGSGAGETSTEPSAQDSPHRFDPNAADVLEDPDRFRYLSRDELVGALTAGPTDIVVEIGSGTGFYTREVAPFVGTLYAVDMQPAMHRAFEANGLPDTVTQVLAKADSLPFRSETIDAVYATMTFHEFDTGGPDELYRVLRSGGTLVLVDWAATGSGERGPPLDVRADLSTASETVEQAGFEITAARSRPETFRIEAVRP